MWSSPATRCLTLARAIVATTQAELRIDDRLQELNFGEWEGLRWDNIARAQLDRWAAAPAIFAPPGGESGLALLARVHGVYRDLRAAGLDAAVISHGGPLRLLHALARGAEPDLLAPPPPFGAVIAVTC